MSRSSAPPPGKPPVWLLEDSQLEATLAMRSLADEFEVEWFHDGESLLERLALARPEVLVLDAQLPGISGLDVCRFVRESFDELSLPVLFLTAHESQADVVDVLGAGANDYLRKPYNAEELSARIRTLSRMATAHGKNEQSRQRAEALAAQLTRIEAERAGLLAREREAREQAERSNHAKDEFLATVSHELRTPLNAILGWARLLDQGLGGKSLSDDAMKRGLQTIERNAFAQAQLIEDLLDVSRITTGKLRLDVEPVELVRVIDAAIESLRPALRAKEQSLECAFDPAASPAHGDASRLQQIVWNLLSNAIKFTPNGGHIRVSLRRHDAQTELSITDSGRGIRADFLPHVFERFEQQESGTTRPYGGLGLGLAISRHIVELHGGTIEARSEGEGKGATFVVRIPSEPPEAAPPSAAASRLAARASGVPRPAELVGLRILVVDDEPDARELMAQILEPCGAEVSAAASVDEAVAALTRVHPDMLLSDIGMPDRNGYELVKLLRAHPNAQLAAIPAAAVTAYARAEDRRLALDAGFQLHIAKPIDPEELVSAVATLARARRA